MEKGLRQVQEKFDQAKSAVVDAMDINGNGEIDIEDVIILSLRVPGIRINRAEFLKKEFVKWYSEETIRNSITYYPAYAGIPVEKIDMIADEVIEFERKCVSGISVALGIPGGVAMAATIPADITQYYGYMMRAAQKLLYLYGFPEISMSGNGEQIDSETMNILIICLGVMYGVNGANKALNIMAKGLATRVERKLINTALTKGTVYPAVKSIARWFNVTITKEIFAGFFKKAIPVVGGVIGGGITYLSFKPCCNKLKKSLRNTRLSNPGSLSMDEEENILIDVE